MSLNPATDVLTNADLASLFDGDSSSDDEQSTKKKQKAKAKKQKAKANKQQQQQQPTLATTSSKEDSTITAAALDSTTTSQKQLSKDDKVETKNTLGEGNLAKDTLLALNTTTEIDSATLQRQRRLQLIAEALKYAQTEATKLRNSLNGQSDEYQQEMIEKLEKQHRETQKKFSSRHNLIEKKSQRYVSLETLRSNAAAMNMVEDQDRTAPDPFFLVFLKAYLANIAISNEWSQKRRLYSNKTGNEKTNFFIPPFIEALNARHLVQRDDKTGRQELAAMARAKVSKNNIDYQQWDDAFFIHMPRIKFDPLENTHYEDKAEVEKYNHMTPFDPLSGELQRALGLMTNSSSTPLSTIAAMPPWIPAMQRHGPPPAYPNAYIPGVNAPLPPGAEWSPLPPPRPQPQQQFQYQMGPNGQMMMVPTQHMPPPPPPPPQIPAAGSIQWGQKPIERVIDQKTGQMIEIPRWNGDLLGTSSFMRSLSNQIKRTLIDLTLKEAKERENGGNELMASDHYNGANGDNQQRVVSLTGAWYPMSKIAPPNNDMSLLVTTVTPLSAMNLEAKFDPNFNFSTIGAMTPALFGAVDYIGFDKLLQQQMEEANAVDQGAQQEQVHLDSYLQPQTTTTTTTTNAQDQARADNDAKWRQEQRQKQLDKALPSHLQHVMGNGAVQLTGNQTQSVYAPQSGQLFTELDATTNTFKRKVMDDGGLGPVGSGDGAEQMIKRQKQNQQQR